MRSDLHITIPKGSTSSTSSTPKSNSPSSLFSTSSAHSTPPTSADSEEEPEVHVVPPTPHNSPVTPPYKREAKVAGMRAVHFVA